MSTLPPELDFSLNPEATPTRMDKAMTYIVARFRPLEAQSTDYTVAINELQAFGLLRLNEALTPIFTTGQQLADDLQAKHDEWYDNDLPNQLALQATAAVIEEFEDYRHRYWGAFDAAPTTGPEGQTLVTGAMYFDTVIGRMRVWTGTQWLDAGSVVNAVLDHQSYTAAGGETTVTVTGGYDAGNIIVFLNGYQLPAADVTVTSGTQIGLIAALSAGDELSWVKFTTVTLVNVYTKVQSDAQYLPTGFSYSKAVSDATYATIATTYTRSVSDSRYARRDQNLSDLSDAAAARTNLGLGTAATKNTSYTTGSSYSYTENLPSGLIEKGGLETSLSNDGARYVSLGFANELLGLQVSPRVTTYASNYDQWAIIEGTPNKDGFYVRNASATGGALLDFFWTAKGR